MKKITTVTIAYTAVFTALVFAATLIQLKMPYGGNVNLGDTMILACAYLMGALPAAVAGGIGASLCDLAMGYTAYAPFTLIIKIAEGLICGILLLIIKKKLTPTETPLPDVSAPETQVLDTDKKALRKKSALRITLCIGSFIVSVIVMALGYYVVNGFLYGFESALIAGLPFDLAQGGVSVLLASILIFIARLDKLFYRIYNRKK